MASKTKTEMLKMLETNTAPRKMQITVKGPEYVQIDEFVYLGGHVTETIEVMVEIKNNIGLAIVRFRNNSTRFYDYSSVSLLEVKVQMLTAEVPKKMGSGCMMCFVNIHHYKTCASSPCFFLLCWIGFRRNNVSYGVQSN